MPPTELDEFIGRVGTNPSPEKFCFRCASDTHDSDSCPIEIEHDLAYLRGQHEVARNAGVSPEALAALEQQIAILENIRRTFAL
jgi:hypothetical protein